MIWKKKNVLRSHMALEVYVKTGQGNGIVIWTNADLL